MPITKLDVDAMQPGSLLWDSGRGSVSGFGVRKQRRYPVFVVKAASSGKARWISIGKFGAPWTVDTARAEAKRLLGRLAAGESVPRKRATSDGPMRTVAELCDRYLMAAKAGAILTRFNRPKKSSTLDIDVGRIERHIKPLIGPTPVDKMDRAVVVRLIGDITVGKTAGVTKTKKRGRARVTGGKGTATRVADLLSGIMSWAVDQGLIQHNPVHGVRRYRSQGKDRFLSDDEIRRLGAVLAQAVDKNGYALHPHSVAIAKLLLLTGCRRGEITDLRWDEVDLELNCLRLDDTKTGRSLRPISKEAVDLLRSLPRQVGSEFVFPAGRGDGPYQGFPRLLTKIMAKALVSGATSHTLRHTFASVASGLGFSDATIGGIIGHAGRGVTSRYIHRPDAALSSAAQAVSAEIARLMRVDSRVDNGPADVSDPPPV